MTTFSTLQARHAADARATLRFMVRPLTKAGVPSAAALTEHDWRLNAFTERADAEARVQALAALNPGRRYVVAELGRGGL